MHFHVVKIKVATSVCTGGRNCPPDSFIQMGSNPVFPQKEEQGNHEGGFLVLGPPSDDKYERVLHYVTMPIRVNITLMGIVYQVADIYTFYENSNLSALFIRLRDYSYQLLVLTQNGCLR